MLVPVMARPLRPAQAPSRLRREMNEVWLLECMTNGLKMQSGPVARLRG